MNEYAQRLIASISNWIAMTCGRSTLLEDIHARTEHVGRTRDFTDVIVIDGDGREVHWPEVSRIGNDEMGRLIRKAVSRLYMFQAKAEDLLLVAMMDWTLAEAKRWDEPELDDVILSGIASSRRRAGGGNRECGSTLLSRPPRQAPPRALARPAVSLSGCGRYRRRTGVRMRWPSD